MVLKISLIGCGCLQAGAHGRTEGETALDEAAKERLARRRAAECYPQTDLVFAGDAGCCRETAAILYPRAPVVVTPRLALFASIHPKDKPVTGVREGLDRRPRSSNLSGGPEGESPYAFQTRCILAFQSVVGEMAAKGVESTAIIAHNPAINIMMERFCIPRAAYRDWSVEGGMGHTIEFDTLRRVGKNTNLL